MVTETLAQIAYFVIHLPLWGRSRAVFGALLSSESNVSSRFSFFLFLTVFSQPFTEKMDTPSPHSIEWDGIKHLSEEKEHGQASYVLILIGTVNKYTTLVDSWIIIYCITRLLGSIRHGIIISWIGVGGRVLLLREYSTRSYNYFTSFFD